MILHVLCPSHSAGEQSSVAWFKKCCAVHMCYELEDSAVFPVNFKPVSSLQAPISDANLFMFLSQKNYIHFSPVLCPVCRCKFWNFYFAPPEEGGDHKSRCCQKNCALSFSNAKKHGRVWVFLAKKGPLSTVFVPLPVLVTFFCT